MSARPIGVAELTIEAKSGLVLDGERFDEIDPGQRAMSSSTGRRLPVGVRAPTRHHTSRRVHPSSSTPATVRAHLPTPACLQVPLRSGAPSCRGDPNGAVASRLTRDARVHAALRQSRPVGPAVGPTTPLPPPRLRGGQAPVSTRARRGVATSLWPGPPGLRACRERPRAGRSRCGEPTSRTCAS